ncbi:MAG: hypothetical protein Q8P00_06245, partial [Dehalococcoidia bacterium]|nr:hypothetical protein [Dehalococcoidia bacterium]
MGSSNIATIVVEPPISSAGDHVWFIPQSPIASQSPLEHPHTKRAGLVHVIVYANLGLSCTGPVQPPSILRQDAFPRDRQGQEQGIKTAIIESLSGVAAGGQYDSPLLMTIGRQLFLGGPALPRSHTTPKDDCLMARL